LNIADFLKKFSIFKHQIYTFAQLSFDVACRSAAPFCSDEAEELTFPNITGEDIVFQGLGCLDSTRNSSWYFIRIDEAGELIFDIQQWVDANGDNRLNRREQQLDVDFIAWGPFTSSFINCEDDLPTGCDVANDDSPRPSECVNNVDDPTFYTTGPLGLDNTSIVDCSFARNTAEDVFIETFTIPDAQTGEYYFILITNFSDESGVIQLQQTNLNADNAGTTDCSILEPGVGPDISTCGEFPITIEGRFPNAVSYQWQRADLGTTNFTNIGVLTDTPVLDVNLDGVYQLIGYSDVAGTTEVGRDDLSVVDVSAIEIMLSSVVAEESFAGGHTINTTISTTPVDIQALGFTDFEYRLERDFGVGFVTYRDFRSSSVFENIPAGDYRVVARYVNCPASERMSEEIMILGYPRYFTPNGDIIHDTWNIVNIENQPGALIYIFDRYGKLLKQLRPGGPGWDGTYNGKLMPSSDYWFRVEFNEPTDPGMRRRVFAGNFSLIR